MGAGPIIEVRPIYGWGWIVAGKPRFEVPAPFRMRLEGSQPKLWTGIVLDEGHEFGGRRAILSQRHLEWTGYVNIAVESSNPADRPTIGFGQLAAVPSALES